ncbi:hypothetical protein F2Q69_00046932 [Brassica cretica]|uniref:Uncharacterized protein n=1 Tax=Brassica cretica TaxID=69181 RepID=A0A8S9PU27_BRACR|nr:hypothetical protein F2Q69_00046932 [Brassica cretica]
MMADVARVIVVVSFSHKTHRNLSEEVGRRFYKNWANSKKKQYGSEESIRSYRRTSVVSESAPLAIRVVMKTMTCFQNDAVLINTQCAAVWLLSSKPK